MTDRSSNGTREARKSPDRTEPNRIGPDTAKAERDQTKAGPARSLRKGDVPQALLDRYLVERDLQGRAERFYRDHRAANPAFRDTGRRLIAALAYPDTVADMLKVAQHRGWTRLKLEGDEAFRREAWIQARALGFEAKGYRPRDRDHQAAGRPKEPGAWEERLHRATRVVQAVIADPEAQQRLIAYAVARLGVRLGEREASPRERGGRDRR